MSYGIIIFNKGELPCPDCLPEARGCQLNPFFEACTKESPGEFPECGSKEYCPPCQEGGELLTCDTCGGTGRIPV